MARAYPRPPTISDRGDGRKTPLDFGRLTPTPVYDTYWQFAAERQLVFFRRTEGHPPPWTDDPILRTHKFTNAYRASDRVSQYLIRNVIYRDDLPNSPSEVVFRILLFKFFNKIETWEILEREIGPVLYSEYSFERYDGVLGRAMEQGRKIYSAAYIMPSGGAFGHRQKHRNNLALLEQMMSSGLPDQLSAAKSMDEAFAALRRYPTIGDFLAYQYVTDINYSRVTDFSEMEFVVPGPGAVNGIRKCFSDTGGISEADVIRIVAQRQAVEFETRGLRFLKLWGRDLQLIDIQNLFCEVDKYARVAHPDFRGVSDRTRIKQKFRPSARPLALWYPPKWGINETVERSTEIVRAVSGDRRSTTLLDMMAEGEMDLRTYQQKAKRSDLTPGTDERSRMIPLAGLVTETGELLNEYKKFLRDGGCPKIFKERMAEEVGDLLWYVANVATKFDLDLDEVAEQNLAKCESRWGPLPARVPFDAAFPAHERFPRRFALEFLTIEEDGERKVRVMYDGKQFGDKLTDNTHIHDGYGYHDVLHLAFASTLGWSPLVRRMVGAKRKSDPQTDRIEDGGRAIAIEEGLAAMVFAYARDYNFLEGKSSVSSALLRMIKNMVQHLEVSVCSTGEWEYAIVHGFRVWREVRDRRGGIVEVDLDRRFIAMRAD